MEHFISRWLVLTIAAGVMVTLLPGMHAVGEPPILGIGAFALFLALINASIKPIVHTIALPFSILSFGLIALIINWLFMELASGHKPVRRGSNHRWILVVRNRIADYGHRLRHCRHRHSGLMRSRI